MAYITFSNYKKIIRKTDREALKALKGNLYKRPIKFYSPVERASFLGLKEFMQNPEKFIKDIYRPIKVVDTLRYVIPEKQPAYHKTDDCTFLQSDFTNFEVPIPIVEKGKEEVEKFRAWFLMNQETYRTDTIKFIEDLTRVFRYVGPINPRSVEYDNSGTVDIENLSLDELETRIDTLLDEATAFFRSNPDLQKVISKFARFTFLGNKGYEIRNNDTHLTDKELKKFLREYSNNYKKPVSRLLVEYYRVLYNPDLEFKGELLEQLGFHKCGNCFKFDLSRINLAG